MQRVVLAGWGLVVALISTTADAQGRWQPGAWWLAVGLNSAGVEDADKRCPGGQIALGVGRRAFLKLQRSWVTYEAVDHSDSCDAGFAGDSLITEGALLLGVSSRNTGLFAALGPARVDVDDERVAARVEESGVRLELGWSSRRKRNSDSGSGLEIAWFNISNGARDYQGIALNWTLGPGGR